jgi:hypothetical protein
MMLDQIQGDNAIESKAVVFEDSNEGFQFPAILTAFEYEDNEALKRSGFRGRYVLFTLMEGRVQDCFYDPRKAKLELLSDDMKGFMQKVVRGWETHGKEGIDWTDLEHGGVYDFSDYEEMRQ